jgi:hypothetical protein
MTLDLEQLSMLLDLVETKIFAFYETIEEDEYIDELQELEELKLVLVEQIHAELIISSIEDALNELVS